MPTNEAFDIYDAQGNPLGTATRADVHREGYWHRTFHCWVVHPRWNGEPSVLLQLRHKTKDTYPDKLDISAAGHLLAGEHVPDGIRELKEELGLDTAFDELIDCGMSAAESMVPGQWTDREFNHIFVYECDKPLREYAFQRSEIAGLFFVSLRDFKRLVAGEAATIAARGIVVNEDETDVADEDRTIGLDDLTPNSAAYYERLFAGIERIAPAAGTGRETP